MPRSAALEVLRQKYPWPSERPAERPISWVMDGGGRQRLIKIIQERRVEVMIEIGVFMGGSLRTWLNASPSLEIVAIDPWPPLPKGWSRHPHVVPLLRGKPAWVGDQVEADPDAFYRSFLSSAWDLRDRVIPIRAKACDVLEQIASSGLKPDLIYLDADKTGEELTMCERLFPGAILAGDDWFYTEKEGAQPLARQRFPDSGSGQRIVRAQKRLSTGRSVDLGDSRSRAVLAQPTGGLVTL